MDVGSPAPGASLRALPLARATEAALLLTIVLVVFGSSGIPVLVDVGSSGRWAALVAFTALACAWAVDEQASGWDAFRVMWPAMLLSGLALASTAWSVDRSTALLHALAFACLVLGAAAAGAATRGRADRAERLALVVVASAALVCLAGALAYAVDPTNTVTEPSVGTGFRFNGLGGNANTVPMLAAVGLVLAGWLGLAATGRARRLYAGAIVVFGAEIVASGSRGALLAAPVGLALLAVGGPFPLRRRAVLLAGVVALAAALVVGNRIVQRETAKPIPPPPASTQSRRLPMLALPPLTEELGPQYVRSRVLIGSDGRALAIQEAFEQGRPRAAYGWGFGTETRVFEERSSVFESAKPEDSYASLFLELGAAGLALYLVSGLFVAAALVVARRRDDRTRLAVSGAAATVAAGFALAIGQSYVYAAGNVATLSVWLASALAAALAFLPGERRPGSLRYVLAGGVALALLGIPVGLVEASHARHEANAGVMAVWRGVGSRLAAPTLDGFRLDPPRRCLLYRAGGSIAGYELCFDGGNAVEAIDRRNGGFQAWTVRPFGPGAAALRVGPAAVDAQLRRLGAFGPGILSGPGYLARRLP
ncbi:MAG TPA: hypothetical protein VHD91_09920 [Gaiellaceae bacterium]|nr:hypothetical protein [Gaiellaceae bacterium]